MKNKEQFKFDSQNAEQQKAFDLVANTNTCLFITGKAGTGKTVFIKRIQEEIDKEFLVLAPTGIAAIAVGGQTIHSFFEFPLQAIGPHTEISLSPEKEIIINQIDTIIVDEASMVRSDMVDGMDRCLRLSLQNNMPFGGKQVVFVGDLFQLPPVVKEGTADAEMLHDLYGAGTPFFYKAFVLKRMNLPKIEFQKVYRQTDEAFLSILDKMRSGDMKDADLKLLNEHVGSDSDSQDFSVTLSSFNMMAEKINEEKLNAIEEEEFCFQAEVEGNFKSGDVPVPEYLRLKVGAQVIFCRNNPDVGYMNGTIGKVSELNEDLIHVLLEDGSKIQVGVVTWQKIESVYNRNTRRMESEVVGSFTQFPLKLAWAITIHKSQGMTFERMHFDLTRGTFQAGQAYVAISRLRSLDGLTLSNPIRPHHITQNPEVRAFANSFNDEEMINEELEFGKMIYKYLNEKDYNMAAKMCLIHMMEKIRESDYRNAALIAKKMFDIMLDDSTLLGMTKNFGLLKDCSMTSNFLNAVICLYGNRYDEAIGYADMVLDRRSCLEAMFVKGRALYELEKYDNAYDIIKQIVKISKEGEEKKAIDKKLLLFETMINERIGNSVIPFCKKLLYLCPEYLLPYRMMREYLRKACVDVEFANDEKHTELLRAFNDVCISHTDFLMMVQKCEDEEAILKLRRTISNIKA